MELVIVQEWWLIITGVVWRSYQAVESMRQGMTPAEAARDAIARIRRKFPPFIGAVFAINKYGIHAGACHGWVFQYTVQDAKMADAVVFTVKPDMP
jgi:N4-(beta-N-acetylglucosaminyl)-L-asparaginase